MRKLQTNIRKEDRQLAGGVDFHGEYQRMFKDWISGWKEIFNPDNISSDVFAGLTVAAIALPLNLALAVASGLPPAAGLLAGAIGGAVAAAFGGARFQVTGPAAALNVMVFLIVKEHGAAGAAIAAIGAGFIALALGFLLAGKIVRLVPEAVLAGFTTGVGIKILDQQIPELLGFDYRVTELAEMMHRPVWLHEVSWLAVLSGLGVAFLVIATREFKRFPAALAGVTIVTALSIYLNWDIQRVGTIPAVLPSFFIPTVADDKWLSLILAIIPLGLLGAAESLLSAQVLDRNSPNLTPHNPNLELFGQGLANLASGFAGGMPVTGVVVRSSANVQSGAKSRLSSLIHAAILLFSVLFLSDQLAQIPLASLSGMLCVIGARLIEFDEFMHLLSKHKVAALAFVVTLLGTVTGHLVLGLLGGVAINLLYDFFAKENKEDLVVQEQLKAEGIRAVLNWKKAEARRPSHFVPTAEGQSWAANVRETPLVAKSAFVHPEASVIGRVVLGEHVHVAADTSVRADEGTPFFIGDNSNVQDGVVMHALKERYVKVGGERWAVYVGKNVSMAHQALVHGPCYIGDNSFIGFKAVVHDSIVGANCFIGIGAVVVGVEIPDGRFVPHGRIVDTADKADDLPPVSHAQAHFNEDVVEVNRGLAAAYRLQLVNKLKTAPDQNSQAAHRPPEFSFLTRF